MREITVSRGTYFIRVSLKKSKGAKLLVNGDLKFLWNSASEIINNVAKETESFFKDSEVIEWQHFNYYIKS